MAVNESRLLHASVRAIAGWDFMQGKGDPNQWNAAMKDLMHVVDECDDQNLSSQNARLIDVARNAVDSWVDRSARRKHGRYHAYHAMDDLELLVDAIYRPAWRRTLRQFLPAVTFLLGIVTDAFLYWHLTS